MFHVFHQTIPTPARSAIHIGVFTLHFYALTILLAILISLQYARKRAGYFNIDDAVLIDLAAYLVPAGIIGARLYHVLTTPERYFGSSGNFIDIFKIWEGGMGIWGAIALASFVGWLKLRRSNISFAGVADLLAPALLVGQGIGRWGNWFNGELFGSPTKLPWGLSVPYQLRPDGYLQFTTFHPVFLYESLWCFLGAYVISKIQLQVSGSRFLAYISWYCAGRSGFELLRIDHSAYFLGMRVNFWVSLTLLISSGVYLITRERTSR